MIANERKLREVVSPDAEKTRQTKSESYSLLDAYEVDLLNYAEDPKHGNYSEFIKRAVAFYRDFHEGRIGQIFNAPVIPVIEEEEDDPTDGFL